MAKSSLSLSICIVANAKYLLAITNGVAVQKYLLIRLILFIPTLLIASVIIFFIMRILPGDVVQVVLGGTGQSTYDSEQLEALREELGLKEPLVVQYSSWIWQMVNGSFGGRSLEDREEISNLLARQLPVTLLLTTYALLFSFLVSLPMGVLAASWHNRWPDYTIRFITISGQAIPSLCAALLVILLLLVIFDWSPPIVYTNPWTNPWNHFQIMIWPSVVLGWGYSSHLTRIARSSMLDVLTQDYIRTAKGKGLGQSSIIIRHSLRNALIPVFSVVGLQIGAIISGTVILESIFLLPGIGRGIVHAVTVRDYSVIQSLAVVSVFLMLSVNLLIDLGYAILNPQISYES